MLEGHRQPTKGIGGNGWGALVFTTPYIGM